MVSIFEVQLPGYSIKDKIYSGTRTLVYRGIREQDQKPVVIKLMRSEYPSFHELLHFRNQYVIAKNLDLAGVVQPYSLETYHNGYALVMEDFGGISFKEWGIEQKNTQSIINFLQVSIPIADILYQLHSDTCGGLSVIHKDIKPANILINPDTKEVKLIDFSIASLLPREIQEIQSFHVLEGTLAYLSPEQTGRMNRGVDYRTDFYSLGITFYELLTGKLPFNYHDPIELVHAHLAKEVIPPHQINIEIPEVISQIIIKLMAKNAEERYQSALGLKSDLETCLHSFNATGEIPVFEIGKRDFQKHFMIPEKLYGREREVEILLNAFERVANGASELMLVAGFSGIGKTAVVNEVHKPIVKQRGYFIKGKFDQFSRNIPFSAFVQAFRNFMRQLLTEPDAVIQQWKTKIAEALGENGQIIIEVIPELEFIIGQQPPVPELSGSAAQNRFNLLLQKFIQAFTTKEHPLVIFLDDLQWADSASLKLIELLISVKDNAYLLLIGAYRDNEVTPTHPLMLTLDEVTKLGAVINRITLQKLSYLKSNQLVADTLGCVEELAWSLSQLVYQKTQGNPFFATQFLKSLHHEGLIEFNLLEGCWQCDITQINQQALTDDVVEFMAFKLKNLPPSTQQVLQLAACISNQFDLKTLAVIFEQSDIETAMCLWKALEEGLILPQSNVYKFYLGEVKQTVNQEGYETVAYKFLHDRVQQAAYSLIPESEKQSTHLKIGWILLKNTPQIEDNENIFAIVNQLNIGVSLITEKSEKNQLAQLNLIAGRKAKSATAYEAATNYLNTALELLEFDCWQSQYDLTLKLYIEMAESEYLRTNFSKATELTVIALEKTEKILDKVKIWELQMQICISQLKMIQAVEIGLEVLGKLNITLVDLADEDSLVIELPNLADIDEFLVMTDPHKLAAMGIIKILCAPVFMAKPEIFPQVIITMVKLCIEYGNSELSAFAYCFYGLLLAGIGKIDAGYYAGNIALKLLDKFEAEELKAKIYNLYNSNIRTWKEHTKNSVKPLQEAVQSGLDNGDIEWGGYAAANLCSYLFFSANDLEYAVSQQAKYIEICMRIKQEIPTHFSQIWRQLGLNLQGLSSDKYLLVSESFNEMEMLPQFVRAKSGTVLFIFYVAKTILLYQFKSYAQAIEQVKLANEQAGSAFGFMQVVILNFYHSLALLANYLTVDAQEKQQYLEQVTINQEKMKVWAEYAPINNQHRYNLVEAERLRVLEQYWQAAELYDRAITQAKANEYIQEEAIANELAAKLYLEWGKEKVAAGYMQEAYYCYARWGALAKVDNLEKLYPQLLQPILHQRQLNLNSLETITDVSLTRSSSSNRSTSSSSNSISDTLDFISILKAAQAISSAIELDQLIISLTRIILENSGAKKTVLILPQEDTWQVRAITYINQEANSGCEIQTVLDIQAIETCPEVPKQLIYYVKNTQETVVIDNLQTDISGLIGEYMQFLQPKSALCMPILNQGHLLGILYLENQLTQGVFTSDRLLILNFLCTQAGIALENAQLYTDLQANKSLMQKLANNIPGVIYQLRVTKDGSASMPYISSGCYNLYGITAAELMSQNKNLRALEHPEDVTKIEELMLESAQNLTPFQHEWRIITPTGQLKWIQAVSQPEAQEDGSLVWDGIALDITERKQAEATIQQKSQELEQALQNLQQAQLKIIQSEKMSALGNLVAGVAHEINNPLGFISGNIEPAYECVQDLFNLLTLYQEKYPQPCVEIQSEIENINLEYLQQDLPKLIASMKEGVQRIREISHSLRIFSRADADNKALFNIHDGLNSTILILKHRLKTNENHPAIKIKKNYGDLPQIECFPGQLNQVFMNLLANAIDALEESNIGRSFADIQAHPNLITITTKLSEDGQHVNISIKDNGVGMTQEVKKKVFDHLYTTKMVGKGTGLGLAIARQIIVEKHEGILEVNSELNQGAEFVITLPR